MFYGVSCFVLCVVLRGARDCLALVARAGAAPKKKTYT
jgi:hypothetical protein